jgi:N-acetylmuramoyl-L-alanine amidase
LAKIVEILAGRVKLACKGSKKVSVAISRGLRRVGLLATCTAFLLSGNFTSPAFCRSQSTLSPKQNRITYGLENLSQGNIVLKTNMVSPISAPRIQYLASQTGLSMMVADFEGLVWPYPARMIKLTPNRYQNGISGGAIDFINLGQFQTTPAIFRVTVAAHNPNALKNLSFQAATGSLTVSWLPQEDPGSQIANPQPAPSRPDQMDEHDPVVAVLPPVAPRRSVNRDSSFAPTKNDASGLSLAFTSESLARAKSVDKPIKPAMSAPSDLAFSTPDKQTVSPPADQANIPLLEETPQLAPVIPPTISLSENGPTKLEIKGQNRLSFKSFRLREPERFVVDFDDLPGLAQAELPTLSDNQFVGGIRLGTQAGKHQGRLVCDLTSDTTVVDPKLSDDGNTLSLIFKKESLREAKEAQSISQGVTIVLDAGHGGSDPGAQRGSMQEKEMTLPIVLLLKHKLEADGMKVLLTRSDDTFVSLEDRVRLTNSTSPNLFVSVHINSLDTDRDLSGIETYYQTPQSKTLAECVHESLVNHLDASDRAVRKARFYVINHTPVPAILAEVGFISCKEEREKLISSDYQKRIARALEHGVMLYLSKQSESTTAEIAQRKSLAQKEHEGNNQSAD